MAFQRQIKTKNTILQLTIHTPSRNPGPGRRPLKKREKRNVINIPKTKEQRNIHLPSKSKVVQAEIQVQEGVP